MLLLLVLMTATAGCPCVRSTVNASPGLRWWLFSNFGASQICPEMLKRGMGLRLQDRAASVGRFWPNQCSVDVDGDRQVVTVNFSGTGYAYHSMTRRVGFSATASVEYRPDFYLGEEDIYVWGKVNRIVNGPSFRLGYVENPVADFATATTPLGMVANMFGTQITMGELTRGFTVVRNDETGDDFALGILMPPQKPRRPFDVEGTEMLVFANETTEIRANQRDYLGPFEVADTDQALLMKYYLQGSAVDVMVVDKRTGDMWREAYQTGQALGPPPGPVLAGAPLQPGEMRTSYRLAPGQYYVVIDNTSYAGVVKAPFVPPAPLPEPVVELSYVAQLADID
ncbi:MAG: hypothetical protein JRI23_30085 [Deltaproteobacteria bacterium]|nr:hypothetical protein [Deltaproteobacteria bacterium]MBW2536405.1 hypothetical protein [Deltaproteobacteria bacterium]